MRRALPILVMTLVTTFGWWWCRVPGSGDWVNFPPAADGPWIAYGDSLTAGFGADKGNDYPTLLGKKLGIQIRNFGVSGNTTHDGLARIDQALAVKPKVVLLCLGGNDSLRNLPKDQTFANLSQMIDRFHGVGSFVVLVGVRSASLRDKNADRFEALAREKKVMLIPNILEGVLFNSSLMSDTIHPNSQGYEKVAERLFVLLAPLLAQLNAARE